MQGFRRGGDDSNTIIGIILLIMLGVFVGPSLLPTLLSDTFPFIDEGVPCSFLPTGEDRAFRQSLLGRTAIDPISLRVETNSVPVNATAGQFTIRITVQNNTIGSIAFVFDPEQVIPQDNGSTGLGLIFDPAVVGAINENVRQTGGVSSFPEEDIRILGPRQRCIHRVDLPISGLNPELLTGQATVMAYYRITTRGTVQANLGANPLGTPNPTPIYNDQGLVLVENDIVRSAPVTIPLSATAN